MLADATNAIDRLGDWKPLRQDASLRPLEVTMPLFMPFKLMTGHDGAPEHDRDADINSGNVVLVTRNGEKSCGLLLVTSVTCYVRGSHREVMDKLRRH